MPFEISAILAGVGAGITFGVTTYWKKENQDFVWSKLFSTAVIGGVAGVIASLLDLPVGIGYDYVAALGLAPVLENGLKIVARKLFSWDW